MLHPKQTKFNKMQKGRNNGLASSGTNIIYGEYGLKTISHGFLTYNQIESARRVISKYIKRKCKIWIRVFPDKPITKKPLEIRMGKGKGNVEYWVSVVKPGKILYEIDNIEEYIAFNAFKLASSKLPIKTIFINKNDFYYL